MGSGVGFAAGTGAGGVLSWREQWCGGVRGSLGGTVLMIGTLEHVCRSDRSDRGLRGDPKDSNMRKKCSHHYVSPSSQVCLRNVNMVLTN